MSYTIRQEFKKTSIAIFRIEKIEIQFKYSAVITETLYSQMMKCT